MSQIKVNFEPFVDDETNRMNVFWRFITVYRLRTPFATTEEVSSASNSSQKIDSRSSFTGSVMGSPFVYRGKFWHRSYLSTRIG